MLTGAPVRLTEPILPTGSWQAALHEQETDMEAAALQYGHQFHGATSRFPRLLDSRLEKYSIRGVNIDVLDFARNGSTYDLNTVEYRDFTTGVPGGVPYQAPSLNCPPPWPRRPTIPPSTAGTCAMNRICKPVPPTATRRPCGG